jgi:hypothetical protein
MKQISLLLITLLLCSIAGAQEKADGDLFIPFDVMVDKMINKSTIVSVEFATPLINDYDLYDLVVEFRIGFFF